MKLSIISLALLSSFQESAAFSVTTSSRTAAITRCNLLPGQGAQLEAAFLASLPSEDDDGIVPTSSSAAAASAASTLDDTLHDIMAPIGTARAFAARVFSMPSVPHQNDDTAFDADGVLFPIVGFQMVKDNEDHIRVLPTTSSVACTLPSQNEELYGWYSPGCYLNPFQENPCLESTKHKNEHGNLSM